MARPPTKAARDSGRRRAVRAAAADDGSGSEGSSPPPAARARRTQGRRTEAKLLDAGMQVLGERGFHAARVDDIVRAAAVSHGTFYLYFANKEDLFRSLAVRCADEMTDLAGTLGPVGPGPDGLAELESWLGRFVALYRAYGVVIRAWMEDQVASRELSRLGVRTFAAVAGGLVARIREARPDLSSHQAELQAAALLAMIERFTYFVSSRGLEVDDDVLVSTLAVLIHRGFFAGPARAGNRRRDPAAR